MPSDYDNFYHYRHQLDSGELSIDVPKKLSPEDVKDMEDHFSLIIRQSMRRCKPDEA